MSTSTDSPSGAPPHTMDDGITPSTVNETRVAPSASPARAKIARTASGPRAPEARTNDALAVTCRTPVSRLGVATVRSAPCRWTLYPSAVTTQTVSGGLAGGSVPASGSDALEGHAIGRLGG